MCAASPSGVNGVELRNVTSLPQNSVGIIAHIAGNIFHRCFFFIFIISPSNSTGISLVIINSLMYKKKS